MLHGWWMLKKRPLKILDLYVYWSGLRKGFTSDGSMLDSWMGFGISSVSEDGCLVGDLIPRINQMARRKVIIGMILLGWRQSLSKSSSAECAWNVNGICHFSPVSVARTRLPFAIIPGVSKPFGLISTSTFSPLPNCCWLSVVAIRLMGPSIPTYHVCSPLPSNEIGISTIWGSFVG